MISIDYIVSFRHRIISYYNKYGIKKLIIRAFEKMGLKFYFRNIVIWEKIIKESEATHIDNRLNFKRVEYETLNEINNYFDGWHDRIKAEGRIGKGQRLYVTVDSGNVHSYTWVDVNKTEMISLEMEFKLPSDTACLAYNFVVKEYRNKGIGTASVRKSINLLKQEGFKKIIAFINIKNIASKRVKEKLGFLPVQRCRYIRIMFIRIYIFRDFANNNKKAYVLFGNSGKSIFTPLFMPRYAFNFK